ncbi:MAG: hypothetical protein ACTS4V_01840 [Candidatus Hodgkinia cicadicola]
MLCVTFPEGKSNTFKHIKLLSLSSASASYSTQSFLPFKSKVRTWDNNFHKRLWTLKQLPFALIVFRTAASPWVFGLGRCLRGISHDFWCFPTPSRLSAISSKVSSPSGSRQSFLKTSTSVLTFRSTLPTFCNHSAICYKLCSHFFIHQDPFLSSPRPLYSALAPSLSRNIPLRRGHNVSKSLIRSLIERLLTNSKLVWCFGCGSAALTLRLKTKVFAFDVSTFSLKCAMHNFASSVCNTSASFKRIPSNIFPLGSPLPNAICFECGIPSISLWRSVYYHLKLNGLSITSAVTFASYSRIIALSSFYGGQVWHILLSSNCIRINSRLYRYRTSIIVWALRKQFHNNW